MYIKKKKIGILALGLKMMAVPIPGTHNTDVHQKLTIGKKKKRFLIRSQAREAMTLGSVHQELTAQVKHDLKYIIMYEN